MAEISGSGRGVEEGRRKSLSRKNGILAKEKQRSKP